MATWLDEQIEELEGIVEEKSDSYQTMCAVNRCVLPRSHGKAEPHISLAAFLEMQVRYSARIFAGRGCRTWDPVQATHS